MKPEPQEKTADAQPRSVQQDGSAKRAMELLDVIVRPGDHDFGWAIEEAQELLGYEVHRTKPRRARSFYGIHSPNSEIRDPAT